MIVYHGSNIKVDKPDLLHSRKNVDFGPGFYVTPIYEQAKKWADRFKRRGEQGVISQYELDEVQLANLKVLDFGSYSEEWLGFIMACRRELDQSDYDIVIGGVANDRVFNTVELYFDNLIDKGEAIKRLKFEKPNLQIAIRTQKALDTCLQYKGCEFL